MPDKKAQLMLGGVLGVVAVLLIGFVVASGDLGTSHGKRSGAVATTSGLGRATFNPDAAGSTANQETNPVDAGNSSGTGNSPGKGGASDKADSSTEASSTGKGGASDKGGSSDNGHSGPEWALLRKNIAIALRADRRAAKRQWLAEHRHHERTSGTVALGVHSRILAV
jgi:hypothetical protein